MKSKIDIPLQTQADTQQALLYIQELVDAGYIELRGTIDAEKCRMGLAALKAQGIEPNEEKAAGPWALLLAKEFGASFK